MARRILLGIALVVFLASALALAQGKKAIDEPEIGVAEVKRAQPEVGEGKGGKVIPWHINYQGYLTDNAGTPINGNRNMLFTIWTALSGGSQLWSESRTVSVEDGLFNEVLGISPPIPASVFEPGQSRWLQLSVAGQTLSPRTEITSVGYAYRAVKTDTSVYALNSDRWDGHNWGDIYPNADMVDGHHYSSNWEPDGNNYPTGINFTGTGTKTLHLQRQGMSELTASFTDETGTGYWTQSGSALYANSPFWHVGIGTTSPQPSVRLDVRTTVDNGAGIAAYANGDMNAAVFGGSSSNGYAAIQANANGADWAGWFQGDLGCSGAKPAVVRTSEGPRAMYAMESPEIWFEDVGSGQLLNGKTYIPLNDDFLETVTIDEENPMKVFAQLSGDCNGVYVKKDVGGFEVVELNGGTSNASFDYRVLAKRKGYEPQRMKVVESCYTDRLLYPDDNDSAIPPYWKEVRRKMERTKQR